MLVDAFTYCGELQTLIMRLTLHYPYVDQFWIAEGDHTFSGKYKGWSLERDMHKLDAWSDKLRFLMLKSPVEQLNFVRDESFNFGSPAWTVENHQRNSLSECLSVMQDDDIAIVSDLDEFINPTAFEKIRAEGHDVARLELMNHYYYMNCRDTGLNKAWAFPLAVKARWWRTNPDVSYFRPFGHAPAYIPDAGWHFSYLGGPDAISKKVSSFSHTELDRPDINNIDHIRDSIENAKDYIGRQGHEYAFYPVKSYPEVIQDLMYKNSNYVRWTLY